VEYPSERVIVSHRATLTGEIASLTKIMTFYTTLHIAAAKNKDIKTTTVKVSYNSVGIGGTTAELS
jgi:D-alanyl-D-alanine carboxypeptidase